jgi:hypothetical protein
MKLFQFAVLLHPTDDEKKAGGVSRLVVDVQTVLAHDQNGAVIQAGRAIPPEHMDKLEHLEVAVRPF